MVDELTKQKQEMQKFQEAEMLKHLDLQYKNEIIRSMEWLAEKDDTIFLGQRQSTIVVTPCTILQKQYQMNRR